MVFYFTSNVVSPPVKLFMGLDKYENEHLIKWGWPEDVWFHVDGLSSAHVYLRLNKGENLDDIHHDVLVDACQLVKANSIQGNKMNDIDVVYTMWENLRKTNSMEVGQVSFHNPKLVRKMRVDKRINEIVNRLNKTKIEVTNPDFQQEREQRDALERQDKKKIIREQKEKEKEERKRLQEQSELRSYSSLHKPENMTSTNYDNNDSDDFM
ncbi:hypothetical protein PVAND_011743 [Polypedilum vanderplanki]|uniref:Coiled-coil domain-containing protein 25 n=1 Tax=Polypedilum vanderplanki TaxID=319348 RepID=A0A9J6CLC7_POLVA|nr:hypothetical protein PVAND_011743 [Polypedilum vanderplanki]